MKLRPTHATVLSSLFLSSALCAAMLWPLTASAGINFSADRYVENRQVEAIVNVDGSGGTIIVRRFDCTGCAPENFTFNHSLRVIFDGQDYPIESMGRWGPFVGDIVIAKSDGRLVAVKRVR
jgi:hypothetical protein